MRCARGAVRVRRVFVKRCLEFVVQNMVKKMLRRIPPDTVLPVLTGPLRGAQWIAGASRNAYWVGTYERAKGSAFARAIAPGNVVYDIGAHVGYYTLLAARRVGANGKVYAFEPLPANLEYLASHIRLNGFTNVTIVPAAVSDQSGVGAFRRTASRAMGQLGEQGDLQVQMIALDEWRQAAGHPLPHVVKMDIEGAELRALRGARNLLRLAMPTLLLATHSAALHDACREFLVELGYCVDELEWVQAEGRGELVARVP